MYTTNGNVIGEDNNSTPITTRLFKDGTLTVAINGDSSTFGIGLWTFEDEKFEIHYCLYCSDTNPQDIIGIDEHSSFEGTLTNNNFNATITGNWHTIRINPDAKHLRGEFILNWD